VSASTRTRRTWIVPVSLLLAAALGCRSDTQDVRGGAVGDRTLPQNLTAVVQAADTTGLPAEGALARVALGDIAGVGNNTHATQMKNTYSGDMAEIKLGHEVFVGMK
jgi:hypothetical protein